MEEQLYCGISVDSSGRVTGVKLADKNLVGLLSAKLAKCGKLQVLQLQNNHLSGDLPDGVGSECLQNIRILNLENSAALGGEVSPAFMRLPGARIKVQGSGVEYGKGSLLCVE
jgi:hypothetical protein